MATITNQVLDYQRAGAGLDAVVQSVAEMVYRYPVGRGGFTEEDSAEFLLRFYPRIKRLVSRYRPSGSCFENYLHSSLRWQLRSFASSRAGDRIRLAVASDPITSEEIVGRPAFEPAPSNRAAGPRRPAAGAGPGTKQPAHRPSALRLRPQGPRELRLSPGQAQRLLCLSLKALDRLDGSLRDKLAKIVGCGREWLENAYAELRERTEEVRARQSRFRINRDRAWFRVRCLEARLAEALPRERSALQTERSRWHERFKRAKTSLEKSMHGPTHLEIAEVLGIAKGTVDSGIFKARAELRDPDYRRRLAMLFEGT
ncbi:MAG: hypothetical protein ACOC1I_01960 [Spirochaetota bacterium]